MIYTRLSYSVSKLITKSYSTSFYSAVNNLRPENREAIFSIYGFVRLADEIVDTFHENNKEYLLKKFEDDYYDSFRNNISLNPALNSFQLTVKKYNIDDSLIQAFLKSMKTDLFKLEHTTDEELNEYIYGSAEVVGLMCLKVFVSGNEERYNELVVPARRLGAAFQKVNFLRDIKADSGELNRRYFPGNVGKPFNEELKQFIVDDIENDFNEALPGIAKLPADSRQGVITAYFYYRKLLGIIKGTPAYELMQRRIRVPDSTKLLLWLKGYMAAKLNFI